MPSIFFLLCPFPPSLHLYSLSVYLLLQSLPSFPLDGTRILSFSVKQVVYVFLMLVDKKTSKERVEQVKF